MKFVTFKSVNPTYIYNIDVFPKWLKCCQLNYFFVNSKRGFSFILFRTFEIYSVIPRCQDLLQNSEWNSGADSPYFLPYDDVCKNTIGGSRGRALGIRGHLWSKFFHFQQFSAKILQNHRLAWPPRELAPCLWEILDPPLNTVNICLSFEDGYFLWVWTHRLLDPQKSILQNHTKFLNNLISMDMLGFSDQFNN